MPELRNLGQRPENKNLPVLLVPVPLRERCLFVVFR
jgi:hypothetical protein